MFLSLQSNYKPKTTILNVATKRENLNCILKFRLSANVAQHINLWLIFYDVHIDDSTVASNIGLNS